MSGGDLWTTLLLVCCGLLSIYTLRIYFRACSATTLQQEENQQIKNRMSAAWRHTRK